MKIVKINCDSDTYDIREAASYSMNVEEAINRLKQLPKDAKLAFSLGDGCTFGRVKASDFQLIEVESIEDEKERKRKEEEEQAKEDELYEQLCGKVCEKFEEEQWPGEEAACKILSEIIGTKCECYDHCIADRCDEDEEDRYVMKACFDFSDSPITIRMYYGDYTRTIGYVEFDW